MAGKPQRNLTSLNATLDGSRWQKRRNQLFICWIEDKTLEGEPQTRVRVIFRAQHYSSNDANLANRRIDIVGYVGEFFNRFTAPGVLIQLEAF